MAEKYWTQVRRKARQDTLRALGLEFPERAILRIVAAAIGVAAIWYVTKDHTTADLIFRVFGTVAILALFPLVYIWKLVSVPSKMDAELRDAIRELNLRLDDREQRAEKQRALEKFIERGQEILVACEFIGRSPPDEQATAWEKEVQAFLRDRMGPVYFSRFRNWADIPKEESGIKSEPHAQLWQGMRARLARLHQYIEKLEQPGH